MEGASPEQGWWKRLQAALKSGLSRLAPAGEGQAVAPPGAEGEPLPADGGQPPEHWLELLHSSQQPLVWVRREAPGERPILTGWRPRVLWPAEEPEPPSPPETSLAGLYPEQPGASENQAGALWSPEGTAGPPPGKKPRYTLLPPAHNPPPGRPAGEQPEQRLASPGIILHRSDPPVREPAAPEIHYSSPEARQAKIDPHYSPRPGGWIKALVHWAGSPWRTLRKPASYPTTGAPRREPGAAPTLPGPQERSSPTAAGPQSRLPRPRSTAPDSGTLAAPEAGGQAGRQTADRARPLVWSTPEKASGAARTVYPSPPGGQTRQEAGDVVYSDRSAGGKKLLSWQAVDYPDPARKPAGFEPTLWAGAGDPWPALPPDPLADPQEMEDKGVDEQRQHRMDREQRGDIDPWKE
jgi:hypothetical protein